MPGLPREGRRRRFRIAPRASRRTPRTCADLSRTGLLGASADGVGVGWTRAGGGSSRNSRVAFRGSAIAHIKLIGCRGWVKGTPSETLSVTPVTRCPSCPPGGHCTNRARRSESLTALLHPGTADARAQASFVIRGRDLRHAARRRPLEPPARRAPPGAVARADDGGQVGAEQGAGRVVGPGRPKGPGCPREAPGWLPRSAARGRPPGDPARALRAPLRTVRRARARRGCRGHDEEGPTSEDVGPQLRS